jgi:NAD(P)-dependent dehydrogenase (short-subunit alcohol dehydrogenase family)
VSILSVAGFTNLGYRAHSKDFEPLPSMEGKTVVITGATGGLGMATASALDGLGARVVVVGRNRDKLDAVVDRMPGAVTFMADLSLLAEVRRVAADISVGVGRVDVLVNNVGVLFPVRQVTAEGLEATLATNLAGHFLLTNLLMPKLLDSTPSRVVNISSGGMYTTRIDPERLEAPVDDYKGSVAYAMTKRGQVILTEMYAEKTRDSGVVFHCMHPGWAKTEGVATSLPTFNTVLRPFLRTPAEGADTIVWLAASEAAAQSSGGFWFDRAPAPTHMLSSTKETEDDRQSLWNHLVEITDSDLVVE